MTRSTSLTMMVVFVLALSACTSSTDVEPVTTEASVTEPTAAPVTEPPAEPTTTTEPEEVLRAISAPVASITVDGDASDWADIAGLDLTLEPIADKDFEEKVSSVKVAHDGEYLYVLMTVDDDYDYVDGDPHLSASPSVMWAVDAAAGAVMGSGDLDGEGASLGMVDIWHWELECLPGVDMGGYVSGPGEGKDPGNDAGCNFDDEWSTDPETREDDNLAGAENSLLGVFHHTSETNGDAGTYTFEMRRQFVTGDEGDAQFAVGDIALLALAYWDADNSVEGWDDADHVVSANQGWIEVTLEDGDMGSSAHRVVEAPLAAITVDGDASDWADIVGLDLTLEPIADKDFEEKVSSVKVAHDGEYLYVLMTVDDDYDYVDGDPHLSASPSVMWAVDAAAGAVMGSGDLDGEGASLGMVDIWHWELECLPGVDMGGYVSGPGEGKDPGNDAGCNFDDEWSTDPETREDDNLAGAENSLLGVFHHTSETNGDAGTYTFEMRRQFVTGDEGDAQFAVGDIALLALAYWDADNSVEGWDDADHVVSANQGWIEVRLMR